MTVTKAVVRGILISGLAVSSAQAGSMLTLGVSSNSGTTPSSPVSLSPFSSSYYQPTSGSLTLGVMSNSGSAPVATSSDSTSQASANPTASYYSAPQASPAPSVSSFSSASSSPSPPLSPSYDAYINFGAGPYPNANSLTTGNPQAWYLSPAVDKLFGGVPNAQQQSAFDSTVLLRVQQSFNLSGVPVNLTDNPNAQAAHTLSVVGQTTNPNLSNAIGMTYIGGNGFHFIDNSAAAAQSVDQLEWIVAHNISHELMLAFGVPENYDKSGNFIDARNASWSMITNPNATFSPAAVNALLSQNFQNSGSTLQSIGAQVIGPEAVPEPTTVALWVVLSGLGLVVQRRRTLSTRSDD